MEREILKLDYSSLYPEILYNNNYNPLCFNDSNRKEAIIQNVYSDGILNHTDIYLLDHQRDTNDRDKLEDTFFKKNMMPKLVKIGIADECKRPSSVVIAGRKTPLVYVEDKWGESQHLEASMKRYKRKKKKQKIDDK